ncbi:MAG TPA: TetR family transcriptional regulator [Dehalococcoidia bacterium]|nr:TetR family transcriptional regulator [Dehalococcoidia bacterium]
MTTRPAVSATEPDAPRGRTRKLRRGPLTRTQILDAALRLFSERGFARTSVRDIAQAAGITDAAIYYHFASKRDLFEALIEERGFTAALESLETAEVNIGPNEAIPLIGTNALSFIYQNRDLMKVLMLEAMAEDAVAAEEYGILAERWERAEARILRIYVERGDIHVESVDELAKQCVVTVLGAFADYLMSPATARSDDPEPPEALLEHVRSAMQQIVRGIT